MGRDWLLGSCPESDVEKFYGQRAFTPASGGMRRVDRRMLDKHAVPPSTTTNNKMSTPVPDMIYGYRHDKAFSEGQQVQLRTLGEHRPAISAADLILRFFVVEFKGGDGGIWIAENQVLGGSSPCVLLAERLNKQLRECSKGAVRQIDSSTFSIAMTGTEARLFISWKHDDLKYYTSMVQSYALLEPEQYINFRRHIRNILDWGKDKRLKAIRESLGSILVAAQHETTERSKARPAPSEASSGGGSSSSRKKLALGKGSSASVSSISQGKGKSVAGVSQGLAASLSNPMTAASRASTNQWMWDDQLLMERDGRMAIKIGYTGT
ncbi:Fc.00g084120.m01.CDS01 [Cosmosporella sp. VM-42]